MAMGHERAQAQFLYQGKSLAVELSGLGALWRLAPCSNLAEETQGIRLDAAFLTRPGELESLLGEGVRLLYMTNPQMRLP